MVRLRRGDFAAEDIVGTDPIAVAREFAAAGARWLHIVDLDGARSREPRHSGVIAGLVAAVGGGVRCEVGGGLRSEEAVDALLSSGAWRAVLGTTALGDPALVGRLVRRHGPGRVAAAIDVRNGLAFGEAWQAGVEGRPAIESVQRLSDAGLTTFEVTAIDRDGVLAGPDLDLLTSFVACGVDIIASAGVRSVADLRAIRDIGCVGAIVGRAIYDGSLDLAAALSVEA